MNSDIILKALDCCNNCEFEDFKRHENCGSCVGMFNSKQNNFKPKQPISKKLEELQTKATAYDSKEVQDAVECDRIEKIINNKYAYQLEYSNETYFIFIYRYNSNKELFRTCGDIKLEVLTTALEWVEKDGAE